MFLTLYIDLKSHYNISFKGYFILLWLFIIYHCLFYFFFMSHRHCKCFEYLLLLCVLSLFDLVVLDLKIVQFCMDIYTYMYTFIFWDRVSIESDLISSAGLVDQWSSGVVIAFSLSQDGVTETITCLTSLWVWVI